MAHRSPDPKELTECSHGFASDVVEEGYRAFEALVVSILEPHTESLARHRLSPRQVAHVLGVATRGFKESAADIDELRALIAGLIGITVATLR